MHMEVNGAQRHRPIVTAGPAASLIGWSLAVRVRALAPHTGAASRKGHWLLARRGLLITSKAAAMTTTCLSMEIMSIRYRVTGKVLYAP
jgi:hypothetical protein